MMAKNGKHTKAITIKDLQMIIKNQEKILNEVKEVTSRAMELESGQESENYERVINSTKENFKIMMFFKSKLIILTNQ